MLVDVNRSALLVVDVQEKLMPAIHEQGRVIANTAVLLQAAGRLRLPVLASEQYPKGLGRTVPEVARYLPEGARLAKTHFSCMSDAAYRLRFEALDRPQAVICGAEAHVCVLQTALGLLAAGIETYVVADAVGSRSPDNHRLALERMRAEGVRVVSTEMVLFEWMGCSDIPEFRDLSALIR